MDKRKERSSRQRLRVDTSQEGGEEDGTLLLANPMAGGEVSPQSAVDHTQPKASLSRKIRPKSPSLLRFFVRGTRKASEDIEEATDWTGSDHDDLSTNSQCSLAEHSLPPSSPPDSLLRFNRNVPAYVTMPRRKRRVEKRDSGCHSERSDSASQDKDQLSTSPDDMQSYPVEDRPVGMESLEALHNQIQILVKQDCPEEEMHLSTLHDAVIGSLRHQLEETQQTLDFFRKSDHNLRLALRDAEQRALEAETKLAKSTERSERLENKLLMMAHKYQQLVLKSAPSKAAPPKPSAMPHHISSANKPAYYYSPQVQRIQREVGTEGSVVGAVTRQRPSSAQGHHDSIETCV